MPVHDTLRAAGRFPHLVFAKARRDNVFLKASALAFVSIFSLVPTLAAFSFVGARFFDHYTEGVLDILTRMLPYSEETIIGQLNTFVQHARGLGGYVLLVFLIVALLAFATVEETINSIWHISGRPFRVRLLSFTFFLFWGSILIGAITSGLASVPVVAGRLGVEVYLDQLPLVHVLPFAVTLVGLTFLYWLVPYTHVRLSNAFVGGLVGAILVELLRRGFGVYVREAEWQNAVYGGFALALFFMISIELSWIVVLLGCELAYITQHFAALLHARRIPPGSRPGFWLALAATCLTAQRFHRGHPFSPLDLLAENLRVTPNRLQEALVPAVHSGFLQSNVKDGDSYLVGGDPRRLHVRDLLDAYDLPAEPGLDYLPQSLRAPLQELRGRLQAAGQEALGGITISELAECDEANESDTEQEGSPPFTVHAGGAAPDDPS